MRTGDSVFSVKAARAGLPDRRPHFSHTMQFCGRSYLVGIGYDSEGQAREVWGDGAHQGSELDAMIDDGCILMSLLLQLSYPAEAIAQHLGRESTQAPEPGIDTVDLGAASIFGAIARIVRTAEAIDGPVVRGVADGMRGLPQYSLFSATPPRDHSTD